MINIRLIQNYFSIFIISIFFISSITTAYSPYAALLEKGDMQAQLFNPSILPTLFTLVDEHTLHTHLKTIQNFGPRPTGSTQLDHVGNYIYSSFQTMGLSVTYDEWNMDGINGKNIVASIPGETDTQFIITAHYDTVDISPGADDDGSGIVSILMIAKLLKQYQFHQTITFIIFSGEEIGLLGSTAYAQKAIDTNTQIIGVLSLDKIGYAQTSEDGSTIRHHADDQSAWMIDLTKNLSTQYRDEIGLKVIGLSFDPSSDHKAFVDCGYVGSNFVEHSLNPMYHTSEDTIDYINFSYLAKVTKLAIALTTTIGMAASNLTSEDIEITIKGTTQSYPACLSIVIENNMATQDSANVSIIIQMRHVFRNDYVYTVKEFYKEPCLWKFVKEINKSWVFDIGPRVFTQGLFSIEVIVSGIQDDVGLSVREQSYGLIYRYYRILIFKI